MDLHAMNEHTNRSDTYQNWPHAVLIAIDRLGNAIAGGHQSSTISARVGFFSEYAKVARWYWRALEFIINLAFYPVDGENHCYKAWQADHLGLYRQGSDVTRFTLSLFIILATPAIAILLRLVVPLVPRWSYKGGDSGEP